MLSDEELLQALAQAKGPMMLGVAQRQDGRFAVGLRNNATGDFLTLSIHTERQAALDAGPGWEARLDSLAQKDPHFKVRNLLDEAGSGKGQTRH
ncbi:MAG: hypothetical protein OK454_07020 [Thaumarchaeota archaeon]|nr:hypothetical protein [Nitrososphaerota archaeon]